MLHERVTRRRLVALMAAGLPTVGLGLSGSLILTACRESDSTPVDAASVVAPLLGPLGLTTARQIGAAWRRDHPAEETTDRLHAALMSSRRRHRRWPWQPLPSVESVIASEYQAGDTTLVDGWVLAPTEARLLALVSLQRG